MADPLLTARDIVKSYGPLPVLKGVDFTVTAGEVVCLLGENGAGKSTLSKIIGGIERADSGTVSLGGTELRLRGPADAYDAGIRVVPQELALVPELSVAENIQLGRIPRGRAGLIDAKAMRSEAEARLRSLAMDHIDVRSLAGELRVVDKAFVQIARALTPGAKILIADEPTAPMSGAESDRLIAVLEAITASGVGVVFISHRLDEVFRLGHTVSVLRDGRNALDARVSDLDRRQLVEAMTGRAVDIQRNEVSSETRPPLLKVSDMTSGIAQGVNVDVAGGEIVGIYGNAGSGREDIGPALFGAQKRTSGAVFLDGKAAAIRTPRSAIRAGLAYVPAERRSQALAMEMSVRENLTLAHLTELFVKFGVILRRRERDATRQWMSRMSMKAGSTEVPVGTLSGGTQQKVVLARWLLIPPKVLVLDDPTRGVDIASKQEIYGILREIAANGTAVLVISSDAEELELVCDRVAILRDGVLERTLAAPTQSQILAAAQA